jgi:hypothetical protein
LNQKESGKASTPDARLTLWTTLGAFGLLPRRKGPRRESPCQRTPCRLRFSQMNMAAKSIYLFLSPEKDFDAFCCILTKTQKTVESIDFIKHPTFSRQL